MKESERAISKQTEMFPKDKKVFIENLNNFMRNPNFNEHGAAPYITYITSICKYVNRLLKNKLRDNQGAAIRINSFSQSSVTFKIFIYNKSSLGDTILKHGGNFTMQKTVEAANAPYKIKIHLIDTGYGKSDIPNFYIQEEDNKLQAKVNGKLLKATEAAESLVVRYFNEISAGEGNGYLTGTPSEEITEAIEVISSDFKWDQSCKNNALGIIKFLENAGFKKRDFVAVHPSWIKTREKDIVINEYMDPSDIFLVEKQDPNFETNLKADESKKNSYKNKCKEEFNTNNIRSLGVSLKKLKLLIDQSVEQNKSSEEIFKTPNFFLTGWKLKSSPKVIYKKNPTERDLKSKNYFVSEVSIKVSNSRDSESGESGKTMYFNCIVNGEEKLLFTIRKNGGENFVLEAAGSEGTESQGGKCSKLIDFVVKDQHFKDSLMAAIKKFNLAQEEAKKLAKGEEGNLSIVETEIDNINDVLQRINDLQGFELPEESVKRAAIAFAFAKKLPFFSGDRSVEGLVTEAFSKLGYNGDVYDKNSKTPIFLGFGKDAYYSGY